MTGDLATTGIEARISELADGFSGQLAVAAVDFTARRSSTVWYWSLVLWSY